MRFTDHIPGGEMPHRGRLILRADADLGEERPQGALE
jgi:hypothetical protein